MFLFESQIVDFIHSFPRYKIKREKMALRGILEQRRRVYPQEQREIDSQLIMDKIEAMPEFQNANTVLLYYPTSREVNLKPLLDKYRLEKIILLPKTHSHYKMTLHQYMGEELLRKGSRGMQEPLTPVYNGKIDMMIIPGVGFDKQCNRLGRGGGYYDRFAHKHRSSIMIGVAFDFQIESKTLPVHRNDVPVDIVLTPTRTIAK